MELLNKTKYLLDSRPREITLEKIANESKIGLSWLKSFSAGNIPNPGVNTVERLYNYLSQKTLNLD